jgi:hypothetical protein
MPQNPDKATPELAEAIKSWLAERVSRHKRLEGGVHFIDAVPKNPVSGMSPVPVKRLLTRPVWEDPEEAAERAGSVGGHEGQAVEAQIEDMRDVTLLFCAVAVTLLLLLEPAVCCQCRHPCH